MPAFTTKFHRRVNAMGPPRLPSPGETHVAMCAEAAAQTAPKSKGVELHCVASKGLDKCPSADTLVNSSSLENRVIQ